MIVVDACVAVKLFVAETDSAEAETVLARGGMLIARDLILVEVANARQKAWRRGIIDARQMDLSLERLPALFGRLYPTPELIGDPAVLSRILRHPVPDCVYAVLHWRTGAPVVTADEAFLKATRAAPAWCQATIRLKDFDPA